MSKITNRTVADEYEAVSERVDALYGEQPMLPADLETLAMTKLRRESYARMLGNELGTRPIELECRMESACETCTYFRTTVELVICQTSSRSVPSPPMTSRSRRSLSSVLVQSVEPPSPISTLVPDSVPT